MANASLETTTDLPRHINKEGLPDFVGFYDEQGNLYQIELRG